MLGYEAQDGLSLEESFHGRNSFLWEEVRLSKLFVLKSVKPAKNKVNCEVCGTGLSEPLFEKWGISYFLCQECWSIFASALADEVKTFEKSSLLTALRCSQAYQDYATTTRLESWKTLTKWMAHRIFRYLGKPDGHLALVRGMRYLAMLNHLHGQPIFNRLDVKGSVVRKDNFQESGYDVLLYLDSIQRRTDPQTYLDQAAMFLRPSGLLFLTTRVGTGFDILNLKERTDTMYPYEHVFLPSPKGLQIMLEKAGFVVLETSTPGMLDVARIFNQRDALPPDNLFLRFLCADYNEKMFANFQKFLQKHCLSSSVRMVARKQ